MVVWAVERDAKGPVKSGQLLQVPSVFGITPAVEQELPPTPPKMAVVPVVVVVGDDESDGVGVGWLNVKPEAP
jgi:hypothetical protein